MVHMFDGLDTKITNPEVYQQTLERFRKRGLRLPLISELADPLLIRECYGQTLSDVDPDAPDPMNLFRVHWHNSDDRRSIVDVPAHMVLPPELTGTEAKIILVPGNRFPMIHAHKVLAAYGCLVPRLMSGHFDPSSQRAVWPSTGNYCRGGVAISRILGCRGVAVLPEGMSEERFAWLRAWVDDPADIVRTPGTESNVKEIYDECNRLSRDPANLILNQFSEFGNYLIHRVVTGPALERVFQTVKGDSALRPVAFVSASGSGGTLAAGDYLKQRMGTRICAVEALECPTLLYNGYGEHNIQGIGDKHVPLIHNVYNTDFVTAVSDAGPDGLNLLFNTPAGKEYLKDRRALAPDLVDKLADLGLSSIANLLGSIKLAKYLNLGPDDGIITVATDGADMYQTELNKSRLKYFPDGFDQLGAAETFGRHLLGAATDHFEELDRRSRDRLFNLGYYTWVEQQGIPVASFDARRSSAFWDGLLEYVSQWDGMIAAFNQETGVERPAI
ncbi:MAG: pyridoxal-phosphate dependent enzyme [Gammaproteobacteria bacterium]|nr:pyridoxal-phosphate dependent enzyme [Gammaproteobacteria bacterium]